MRVWAKGVTDGLRVHVSCTQTCRKDLDCHTFHQGCKAVIMGATVEAVYLDTWEQFTHVLNRVKIARPRITEVPRRSVLA